MVRTRFALILYFCMVTHRAARHALSKAFLKLMNMVQILLMLELLFTQDYKVEDLFFGASSGSEPSHMEKISSLLAARCTTILLWALIGKF